MVLMGYIIGTLKRGIEYKRKRIMNEAQKFLLENNLDDIVLNAKQYPENTAENAKKWIYLSDVLEQYLKQKQS